MIKSKTILKCIIAILLLCNISLIQAQQKIGQWRVHLSYSQTKAVSVSNEKIYVAANDAVFYFNKNDNSISALSKVEGLSSIGVNTLRYNEPTQTLVIAYADANIDIIKGATIRNNSDIKRANVVGGKSIRHILFRNELAYLSCSFGIAVLNTERNEIKETYKLGAGNGIEVSGCAIDDTYIYAATDSGIYRAQLNDPFIFNPAAWSKIIDRPANTGTFDFIYSFNQKIIINHAITSGPYKDSLSVYDPLLQSSTPLYQSGSKIISMQASGDYLTITDNNTLIVFDKNFQKTNYFQTDGAFTVPMEAQADGNAFWIADQNKGLLKFTPGKGSDVIAPTGPKSNRTALLDGSSDYIWVGHGLRFNNWTPVFVNDGFARFDNNEWKQFSGKSPDGKFSLDTIFDLICIAADKSDKEHVYFGSFGNGLVEYNNGAFSLLNGSNSIIKNQSIIANYNNVRVGGLAYDNDNNLWICNTIADTGLIVKKGDGTWKKYYTKGLAGGDYVTDIVADDNNQLWINIPVSGANKVGLYVYSHNGTLDDVSDDQAKLLTDEEGKGKLPSKAVRCVAKDREGLIWIGTEKGVGVFYSPGAVFSNGNFDAQQILIKQETYNLYLLDKEVVQAITVDGANRKWFGTQSGGVYLTSSDGVEQILNFSEANSPLLSNNINSIKVNEATGEVFFSTDRGMISYQGDATLGSEACEGVLVFPNPVRETYSGPIAIRGLVNNGYIKITDIAGGLVTEMRANGGQAIWNGTNLQGERVSTGIYLAMCSDEQGTNTCIAKIAIVR